MKIEISRMVRVPEYFPARKIEDQVKKLLVILDAYGVGLGFDFGDDPAQTTKEMLLLTIRETERLRHHLRIAAAKLDLEYPEALPFPQSEPDQSA